MNNSDRMMPGAKFLSISRELDNQNEGVFDDALRDGHLGKRAPRVYDGMADCLSLIAAIASCQWGCRHPGHEFENLGRRFCNYGLAALRLTRFGYYEESLALVRSMGELANLCQMFYVDAEAMLHWFQSTRNERIQKFGPSNVRKRIEAAGQEAIVDRETYANLCELGVHVTPETSVLSHDLEHGRVFVGGNAVPTGFILVVNQMALVTTPFLILLGLFTEQPKQQMREIRQTAARLTKWVGPLTVNNYEEVLARFAAESARQRDASKSGDALQPIAGKRAKRS